MRFFSSQSKAKYKKRVKLTAEERQAGKKKKEREGERVCVGERRSEGEAAAPSCS